MRRLPIERPTGGWEVKRVAVKDRFVLRRWRALRKSGLYPNEVVEREFGVPATTRTWGTIEKIRQIGIGGS